MGLAPGLPRGAQLRCKLGRFDEVTCVGSFLRRCESQSGSFVSSEQRYSDRQNKNSCGVVGRPPHHKRFTPVNVRLPLNTGDEIKAKELRNQIRPREGNILQMPAQREKKSCAASCLNVFFVTGFLFQTQESWTFTSRVLSL